MSRLQPISSLRRGSGRSAREGGIEEARRIRKCEKYQRVCVFLEVTSTEELGLEGSRGLRIKAGFALFSAHCVHW